MVPKSERFEMRVDEDLLERMDEWREQQRDDPSRAEAMRRLVEAGLTRSSRREVQFSDGEKVIILMLRDLFQHLKVRSSEVNSDLIAQVIFGGHYWAAKWELPGLFHGHEDDPKVLNEVVDILEMWEFMEMTYDRLGKKDKERLRNEVPHWGEDVKFMGFDGNNETEYLSIARFLVEKLGRFSRFSGRDMNSHMPSISRYRRMLDVFSGARAELGPEGLSYTQLAALVRAQSHRKEA